MNVKYADKMTPPNENKTVEGEGVGIHAKRNKRKKELAKQRKAEAQANSVHEDKRAEELNSVDLSHTRVSSSTPTKPQPKSKTKAVPARRLERGDNKSQDEILVKKLKYIPTHDGALYEIKPAPGKGLGMFAIGKIKSGTEILREAAIFQGRNEWLCMHAMFSLLSDEKKSQYMALHSQCNCHKEICDETDFQKIWDANSFDVDNTPPTLPENHAGPFVYLVASRINHDCDPNARRDFTEKGHIVIQACKDIEAGEEITISYTGQGFMPVDFRRQTLLKNHRFTCTCKLCSQNMQLSKNEGIKGLVSNTITYPGLPILGTPTAAEEQAPAEIDTWCSELLIKTNHIAATTVYDLLRTMERGEDWNTARFFDRVYNEKMKRMLTCVTQNDKYNLGQAVIGLLMARLSEYALRQTKHEFSTTLPRLLGS